jgi:hypothetical protein
MSRDEWQIERDRAPWTEAMQREKDGATLARIVASDAHAAEDVHG